LGRVRWSGADDKLSEEFGEQIDVVLIDQSDTFVLGFSELAVMFGRAASAHVRYAYRDAVKPDVSFVQTVIRSLDPVAKAVETDVGTFAATCSWSRSERNALLMHDYRSRWWWLSPCRCRGPGFAGGTGDYVRRARHRMTPAP
jgi:hypothetical protein